MHFSPKSHGAARGKLSRSVSVRGQRALHAAIETLETRVLLSTVTYIVQGNSDTLGSIVTPSGANQYNANTLRAAINSANNQSFPVVIQFNAAKFTGGVANTITLTSGLTLGPIAPAGTHSYKLVGPTAKPITISGANMYSDFTINAGISAEFDTLTIAHGNSGGVGGAIDTAGPLTLVGDTFAGNHAADGGAIYSSMSPLTVTNSTFIGNSATDGGALDILPASAGLTTITGSTFTSNSANDDAGAIDYINESLGNPTLTISKSTFTNNSANDDAGAVDVLDDENGVLATTVTASTFSGDIGTDGAGAIYSNGKSLTLTTDTFSGDKSPNGSGGAVESLDKTLIVGASSFNADTAYEYGGAIDYAGIGANPTLTVTTSTFTNCQATLDAGGGIYDAGGTHSVMGITGSTFTHDTADDTGGAVFSDGGSGSAMTLNADTFTGNSSLEGGGGVYSDDVTLIVSGSTFSNDSTGIYDDGGGLSSFATSLTITNSNFTGNSASNGAGVYFSGSGGAASISGSNFSGNKALTGFDFGPALCGANGGAIYSDSESLTLTGDTFNNNQADNGGSVYSDDATLSLANSTFTNDSAVDNGGDVYSDDQTASIAGSSLSNATAEYGAGVYSSYTDTGSNSDTGTRSLSLTDDNFTNETAADNGGAVDYFYNNNNSSNTNTGNGVFQIEQCTFTGNSSIDDGGAVYAQSEDAGDQLNVFDSTLTGNTANDGGGIYDDAFGALIANDTLYGNSANSEGGALYLNSAGAAVTDSTIDGNSAAYADGGGIYNDDSTSLDGVIVAGNYVTGTPDTFSDLAGLAFDAASMNNIIGDGANSSFTPGHDANGNFVGTDFAPINPMLGALGNHGGPTQTQIPASTSLAIGNNQDWPVYDIGGTDITLFDQTGLNARPQAQGYDIGAYQTGNTPVVVTPTVSIAAPATVHVPAGGTTTVKIPVTLSSTAGSAIVLTYSTVGVSASNGNGDYTGVTNATYTIPANSMPGTYYITIAGVKHETAHGPYPKTFNVTLSSATHATVLGGTETVTVMLAYP